MIEIYQIVNTVNGKRYIGQTLQGTQKRWRRHRWDAARQKDEIAVHAAINKYGPEQFLVQKIDEAPTLAAADDLEKFYIQMSKSDDREFGYNRTGGGRGPLMVISEESKKKMSAARKGRFGGDKHPMFGKHHTPESIAKMSEANKGLGAGRIFSLETKEKLREGWHQHHKPELRRSDLDLSAIISMYKQGLSCRNIACRFSTSHDLIVDRLRRAGISIRTKSEQGALSGQ